MRIILVLFFFFFSISSAVFARSNGKERSEFNGNDDKSIQWKELAGIPIVASLYGYLSSEYTEEFGWLVAAVAPFVRAGKYSETAENVTSVLLTSQGLYNALELKRDKYDEDEVFKINFIAASVTMTLNLFVDHHFPDDEKPAFSILPIENGAILQYSVQF